LIRFSATTELHWHKHIGIYIAYGIRACRGRTQIFHIPDVFCRRSDADSFVCLCNREQPEFPHIQELIEDVL